MLAMPLCFLWSAERLAIHNTMAVFWIAPLLVIILAALAGNNGAGTHNKAATVAGFVGALLIYRPDSSVFRPATALSLGMACCFALYLIISRAMKEEFVLTKLFHTALWVFACLSAGLPFFWQTPSLRGFVSMAIIGVVGWCGLFFLDRALELAAPVYLAPMLYTQLIWIILLEAILRNNTPGHRTVAGILLIAGSGLVTLLWKEAGAPKQQPCVEVGS
jgi:drug/metabolite transporter (DMT)-like permease